MNKENTREYTYQGYTLVDITQTGVTRYSAQDERRRNQQRNWETVLQLLSLRTQILSTSQQQVTAADLASYEFGPAYQGKHNLWFFKFTTEFDNVYKLDDDPVGILTNDFKQAPVILNLEETARPILPLFYTSGESKNIYFKKS